MLTDLEFRVWTQFLLSADDAGVMRQSALTIQADNDALAKRPMKMVEKALLALVTIGLLISFEHQGRKYVCDPRWQDFQKVRWPKTVHPLPPAEVLAQCSEDTRDLFAKIISKSASAYGVTSESTPSDPPDGHRLEAKGSGLVAKGNGLDRFERFWKYYPRKIGKDAALREWQRLAPDNDLTDVMCAAVEQQRASAQWLKDGGQYIPHPRTWLHQGRWKDSPEPAASSLGERTRQLARATKEFLES